MPKAAPTAFVRQIHRLLGEHQARLQTDAELLARFVEHDDEVAFTELVRRHGPLVLGVCKRALGNVTDAEDVFQATFLLLARRAGSIRKSKSVASWLFGSAQRLSWQFQKDAARWRASQKYSSPVPSISPAASAAWEEVRAVLDEELGRLVDRHRLPLILCYLQEKTQDEAARELGWCRGTLKRRLERGRELLRRRLVRRGISLPTALFATMIWKSATEAAPGLLIETTVRAAIAFAQGKLLPPGASSSAWALAKTALNAWFLSRMMAVGTVSLIACLFALAGLGARIGFPSTSAATQAPSGDNRQAVSGDQEPREVRQPLANLDPFGDPLPQGAIARVGTSRLRGRRGVYVIAFSADGRRLAYGSDSTHIDVCETANGNPLLDLKLDKDSHSPITELAFSPDGKTLAASGFWCPVIWLIDLDSRKVRLTIPNTADGQQGQWVFQQEGPCLAFSGDGKILIVGGKDGGLHLWDLATGGKLAALPASKEAVLSLTLTADNAMALTAHHQGALHLWDIANRRHLCKLAMAAKYPQFTALAPDGKTLVFAAGANELVVWDTKGSRSQPLRTTAPVAGLTYSADGSSILVGDAQGRIVDWDVQTAQTREIKSCAGISLNRGHDDLTGGPSVLAWFRSDRKAMAWGDGQNVRRWDLTTSQEVTLHAPYSNGIRWASFSADGQLLRAAGHDREFGVWDAGTGRMRGTLQKTNLPFITFYMTAPDRNQFVSVTGGDIRKPNSGEGVIHIWNPSGGRGPVQLSGQVAPAMYASFTPDSHFVVATGIGGRIRVYDAATGKLSRDFEGRDLEYRQTFSPDGSLLATTGASGTTIRLYDFASGRSLRELEAPSVTMSLAFSPDGRVLATGHTTHGKPHPVAGGDAIILWDTTNGKELRRIVTGHGSVWAFCFSRDGRLIASCGDPTVRVWEAASGQERRQYRSHRGHVESVDFAPDDLRLASASDDGTALVWRLFDPAPEQRTAAELESPWRDLAKDGATAHRAIGALIAAKGTVPFIGARVSQVIKPSDDQIKAWLADLGSSEFSKRETAQKELGAIADVIGKTLSQASASASDPEARRRLVVLMDNIPRPETKPEHLRDLRAVEILERIGTPDARRILTDLAKGAPEARLTREAKASLARLGRR
jgi:RNA polymerase sigma factor (sigma-70 family)